MATLLLRRVPLALSMIALTLVAAPAVAITRTWTGATSGAWSVGSNWSPAAVPQPGDTLVFNGSGGGGEATAMTMDMPGLSIATMTFATKSYTLSDGGVAANSPLDVTGGFTIGSPTTFTQGFLVDGDQTWTVNADTVWDQGTGGNGGVNLGNSTLIIDVANGVTGHLMPSVSGAGGLVKAGAGTLELSGIRTYTGLTTILAGAIDATGGGFTGPVVVNAGSLLLHVNQQISSRPLTVAGGATVTMNNSNQKLSTIAGAGSIDLGSGPGTAGIGLEITSGKFSGVISGNGGVMARGNGTVVLTGAETFQGLYRVTTAGAVLQLDGSNSQNLLLSNATATLAGSGSVGDVQVGGSGGTIAPGAAGGGIGTLMVGSLDLFTAGTGGTLSVELNAAASSDTLATTGAVDVTNGALAVTLNYVPTPGTTFRILDNQAGGAIVGTFTGLPEGSTFQVFPSGGGGAVTLQITYAGGTGNDVELAVTAVATTTTTSSSTSTTTSTSTTSTSSSSTTSTSTSSSSTTSTSVSTSTSTVPTTTTTTTLPFAECRTGVPMSRARVTIANATTPGRQKLTVKGTLPFDLGAPVPFNPRATGAQLLVADVASGVVPLLALTAQAGAPVPPGVLAPACNGRRDGWKGTTYLNASGFIDPPTCATPTNGLVLLRIKDRRGSGRGITVQAKTKLSTFTVPTGPLGVAVVLGAEQSVGDAGWCGGLVFAAPQCVLKGNKFACK